MMLDQKQIEIWTFKGIRQAKNSGGLMDYVFLHNDVPSPTSGQKLTYKKWYVVTL